ncbi:hypothetical protein HLV37_02530 [Eggerthellaceae bacterium zg-1084]|uniref:hypothetical protein n=1 Tax=Berryella wangjianweii TaxID=2734634 RepID=UPI00155220F9|nr:hypothetical protein [Berryella wangjianweii]NPD30755.1 hypothetical protein [Berryella wangjianweii]
MSQRNPLNERYQNEERTGKTRKSAASAKPTAKRAGTVRMEPPKTPKQKRAEARERRRKADEKRFQTEKTLYNVPTPEYRRVRRTWWVVLIAAIVTTVASFALSQVEGMGAVSTALLVVAYALILAALYLDFAKARKLRREYQARVLNDKSKATRAQQKRQRAEAREQQRAGVEASGEPKPDEPTGLAKAFGFLRRGKTAPDAGQHDGKADEKTSSAAAGQAGDKGAGK